MDPSRLLLASALGLLALCIIGYEAFPVGDDFAYGPLTEHRINPLLFPRDEQLRLFENHAFVYEWVYRLGKVGLGVEPTFRIAVWILAATTSVAILAVLRGLGAPFAALPLVLGLGVVVQIDGMGRGDYGGLISPFFHHHNAALALVLGALAASLFRKSWLAGVFLGLAAYAQPMTAFHGALIVGLGAYARDPIEVVKIGCAAALTAIPAAVLIFGNILNVPDSAAGLDLVEDAYRYRAPLHYDPSWSDIGLTTLYLLAGCAGAALLWGQDIRLGRFAAGLVAGFALLHLVTIIVYKAGFAEWIGFFVLDANRSTPMLFVVGPSLALAGILRVRHGQSVWISGVLLLAILALNATLAGLALVALGVLLIATGYTARARNVFLIGVMSALALMFPLAPKPTNLPDATLQAFERIRTETPPDALFIIPVSLAEFRHYTQRSAYVDFKLFSVAQPDQAALTRARLEEIAHPAQDHRQAQGWPGARLWDQDQNRAATCETMAEALAATGADFYLRRATLKEAAPNCLSLPRPIATSTMAVYGSAN
ncbi:DUF6798 domain-containing protein [Roseovarius sp. S4756]|uniref:DUF6798 domain-containing protein n=1 Tax=Roseovarius maritimus TaxID=3342637 RepID=UPI0037277EA1